MIAIDGPAGAGKSTVARALARELGFAYLDSGAMYRAVALSALESGQDAASLASQVTIELRSERDSVRVLLDGRDVSGLIRGEAVSREASRAAADPAVRRAMVAQQRRLLADGNWVAEGRDIGTVVAPDAQLKVFLTADPQERARRRAVELGAEESVVLAEQAIRDERDRRREHSPLMAAPDAVVLDTTALTIEQVVARVVELMD